MRPVLSREQSQRLDRRAIEQCQVPGALLMENAGRGACDVLLARYGATHRVLVVTGVGNNAGDGFVVARRLLTLGRGVSVVSLVELDQLKGDAAINARAFVGIGGEVAVDTSESLDVLLRRLVVAELIVDAIFGTGLSRAIDGRLARVIEAVNAVSAPVVALDLPSGIDADSGQIHGVAIHAALTISFASLKRGLLTPRAAQHTGELAVVDIGVPPPDPSSGETDAQLVEPGDVAQMLSSLEAPLHKGEAGRVLVVGGAPGTLGAVRLTARGAHRAGAGLVTVATFPQAAQRLESSVWETMTHTIDPERPAASLDAVLRRTDVVAVGPGLGLDAPVSELVFELVDRWPGLMVLDADALTHLATDPERLSRSPGPRVLTPHPAEAARLLGSATAEIEADRYGAVRELAERTQATVLLKGAYTLVHHPGELTTVNSSGNSALAVGGAGDVLTGMIAALGVRLAPREAAIAGAWLHGRAAERWSARVGSPRGLLARQIADELPRVFGELG